MNRLSIFISMFLVIGLLLIILSFLGFSKINKTCASKKLRQNFRLCVIIGSVLTTISLMYMICGNENCKCEYNIDSNWKIHTTIFILFVMGVLLIIMATNIKKEIKSDGCDVNIDAITNLIIGVASLQILLSVIFSVFSVYTYKSTLK